jgi:hypothetical protein
MQQAIPNDRNRPAKSLFQTLKNHLKLAGLLAGELLALASMTAALTAGFLLLRLALG